ncbi:hypothetical protein C8R47DRAFT_1103573 [Mycena vitilis]|nr:hypothetical protein C8R47DRAFT_1103573 [Mycena vitilis]
MGCTDQPGIVVLPCFSPELNLDRILHGFTPESPFKPATFLSWLDGAGLRHGYLRRNTRRLPGRRLQFCPRSVMMRHPLHPRAPCTSQLAIVSRVSLPWPMVSVMTSLAHGRTRCNTTDINLRPTLRLSSPHHTDLLDRLSVALPLLVRIISPNKIPRKAPRTAPLLLPAHPRTVNLIPIVQFPGCRPETSRTTLNHADPRGRLQMSPRTNSGSHPLVAVAPSATTRFLGRAQ